MSISLAAAFIGLLLGWFALRTVSRIVLFFLKPLILIVLGFILGTVSTLPLAEIRTDAVLASSMHGAENLGRMILTLLSDKQTPEAGDTTQLSWESTSKKMRDMLSRGLESVAAEFVSSTEPRGVPS